MDENWVHYSQKSQPCHIFGKKCNNPISKWSNNPKLSSLSFSAIWSICAVLSDERFLLIRRILRRLFHYIEFFIVYLKFVRFLYNFCFISIDFCIYSVLKSIFTFCSRFILFFTFCFRFLEFLHFSSNFRIFFHFVSIYGMLTFCFKFVEFFALCL